MGKWGIEMAYGVGFTVEVDADSREHAIAKAKSLIENGTTILPFDNSVDAGDLEFEEVTYAQESLTFNGGNMKQVRFESDYSPGCYLVITQSVDGDIIVSIRGDGECRIATDGGKLHGETLVLVVQKFSEIIDLLS